MATVSLKGTIKSITETQYLGASNFAKRDVILVTEEQYPQTLKISVLGEEKCNMISNYQQGQKVSLDVNLNGKEWNDKIFIELALWKIESLQGGNTANTTKPTTTSANTTTTSVKPTATELVKETIQQENIDIEELPF